MQDLIHTVNQIPPTYSGKLTVLLNHEDPVVIVRHLLMLLILGREPDKGKAAELVLHLWYSAFVQAGHPAALMSVVLSVVDELKKDQFEIKLGEKSTLYGEIKNKMFLGGLLAHLTSQYDSEKAQAEYQRVLYVPQALKDTSMLTFSNSLAPEREDYLHRMYKDLEPSHRLSYDKFRRFGLLLPFGAPNAHFNQPNRFLFSRDCEWYQDDGANPLEGWE